MRYFFLILLVFGFSYGQPQTPTQTNNPNKKSTPQKQISQSQTLSNQITSSTPSASPCANNNQNGCSWTPANTLTLIGLIFTAVIGINGIVQAQISARTAKRQTRAYVSITPNTKKHHEVLPQIQANNGFDILLDCNNFGQTPAKNIKFKSGIGIYPSPIPNTIFNTLGSPIDGKKIIHPKEPTWFHVATTDIFPPQIIQGVINGSKNFIVFGTFEYTDIFDQVTKLRFCFNWKHNGWEGVEGLNDVFFPEDNDEQA